MKGLLVIIVIAALYASCKTMNIDLAVPDQFAANAKQLKVSGLNGWKRRPKLSFGHYQTSKVKAGWIRSASSYDRNARITKDERLLKALNIFSGNITKHTRNKYQYTIQDGDLLAEVYCIETAITEAATFNTRLGDFGNTKNIQYSFSAVILPQTIKDVPWQLVFHNSYDSRLDTAARKFWERPGMQRQGYVTDGKIKIDIRPIITDKVVSKDGKVSRTLIPLLMAYELKIDNGLIGVVDVIKNNVWIYNDLDKEMKLIIASVSSAILMRKLDESKM